MPAPRLSRKEKQQQTRTAVLRAASTLFAKQGVEGTSMEAIARHAGLTQGAIYSNFASKTELWWAIAEETGRTLSFEGKFTGGRSLDAELRDVGRAAWRLFQETSRTELLLAQEFDLFLMRNPRERAKYDRISRAGQLEMAEMLERNAKRRGERLPMPAERLSRTIDAVAQGLLHMFMLDPRVVDERLCVAAFAALA
jgi:AcrR family transcriptional regulator